MSAHMYLNDEASRIAIECDDDSPTISLRAGFCGSHGTVSLALNRTNRDALRAALDAADRFDVAQEIAA